ncbi:MAG: 4-alpha-glucanotransferase [Spirochaetae bacterium HGW-Spirochaetae-9]|nr:MAG: 4-alpha-glucanotransferase [Spirochaetae bacterium HGW-Spirochaetae-9]
MNFINIGKRTTGLAIPLLSIRTGQGPCGEFPDLARLAGLARSWNMEIVQLLPVNDTGLQTSPYSALSAFALNPVYLRIGDMPEAKATAGTSSVMKAETLAAEFSRSAKVPYSRILEAKLGILEDLWAIVSAGKAGRKLVGAIEAWAEKNAWVKAYSCFVELKRRFDGRAWWEWPEYGNADETLVEKLWGSREFASGTRFRAWIQMRAAEQFASACAESRALGVDIMGDIPILMNADSADVWFRRDLFDTEKSAGAPPDMYSHLGQNWGFPLYRWDAIEKDGFAFWKERLACADQFYTMYRIDHVLGFFRIWAIDKRENDGFLGYFMPEFPLSYPDLDALGFDAGRIRWLSQPHLPQGAVEDAVSSLPWQLCATLIERLLTRIDGEALYLFAPEISGGKDISAAVRSSLETSGHEGGTEAAAHRCIDIFSSWWRNRTLQEIGPGQFVATWEYKGTQAWGSLSDHEKSRLEALITGRKGESMALWEKTGRKILKVLAASVEMQACAEDLGAVPPCVPAVLGELGIPGLRVLRWHRNWDKAGSPYVPLDHYPEDSIACMSVHDSTNLRQWWEEEADGPALWALARQANAKALPDGTPPLDLPQDVPQEAPAALDPDAALFLMKAFATARSRCVIYPLQDLLAASALYREANPADERINVPGTLSDTNWLYRMKPRLEELEADGVFAAKMAWLSAGRR